MYLLVNTSEYATIKLVRLDEKTTEAKIFARPNRELLVCIDEALAVWGMKPAELEGILVVVGAGGFTSTRIATTVANAFAYVHAVPVVGVTLEEIENVAPAELIAKCREVKAKYVAATYSAPPNIGIKSQESRIKT